MNLLYMDWNSFCRNDVLSAFQNLGHSYTLTPLPETARMQGLDQETIHSIYETITKTNYDFVFTMNYFPMISEACEKAGIPYLSWIYDNPYTKAYSVSIVHSCNYIFTFDSSMYNELTSHGVNTIYYAPMAANPKRIADMGTAPDKFCHDISFIGALYDEDYNFYDEFVKNAKARGREHDIGYIDALIRCQSQLYGTNILAESLPKEIATSGLATINEWSEINTFFTTPETIFADNVLCRKITEQERKTLLSRLSSSFDVTLYTRNQNATLGNCHNKGYADYTSEMPLIFKGSKINLNISLKSIKNGIPLRAIEIMGAGGFLLSNYQPDFLLHFEPDRDFVYYENIDDAIEKAAYYLRHESERAQIAANGLQKINEAHTYEIRLSQMLSVLE